MRRSQTDKEATHRHIVRTAARRFRERGLDGIGVADLMSEAGLTHGGFYKHFASREALVAEALAEALAGGRAAPGTAFGGRPPTSLAEVARAYLHPAHCAAPGEGCAIAALANDVARAGPAAQALYRDGIERQVAALIPLLHGVPDAERRGRALTLLAALVGALAMARAAGPESPLAAELLATVTAALGG